MSNPLVELVFSEVGAAAVATAVGKIATQQRALAKAVAETVQPGLPTAVVDQAAAATRKLAVAEEEVAASTQKAKAELKETAQTLEREVKPAAEKTSETAKQVAVDVEAISRQVSAALQRLAQAGTATREGAAAAASVTQQVPVALANITNAGVVSEAAFQRQQRAAAAAAQVTTTAAVPATARLRDNVEALAFSMRDRLDGAIDANVKQFLALGAAVLSVHTVYSGFKDAIGEGAELVKMSRRVGESVRELVVLDQAFNAGGLGVGALERAANMLQRTLGTTGVAAERTDRTLRQLGTSTEQMRLLSFAEQMRVLEAGFARVENPSQRAALAMRLFGETGAQMLQIFGDAGALGRAEAMAGRFGDRMARVAPEFAEVEKKLSVVSLRLREMWAAAAEQLLPTLHAIASTIGGMNLSALGTLLGAAGPTAAGGLVAMWGIDKLDLALLNAQERFGQGMRGQLAGLGAQFTGALATWLPVGLAAAVAGQIVLGIVQAWQDYEVQRLLNESRGVSQRMQPFRNAAATMTTVSEAATNESSARAAVDVMSMRRAELQRKRARAQAQNDGSTVAGGVLSNDDGLSAAERRELGELDLSITKLEGHIKNLYSNPSWVAQGIAANQVRKLQGSLATLDLGTLQKQNDDLTGDTQAPALRAMTLQGRRVQLEAQIAAPLPAGLTPEEAEKHRLDLQNKLLEVKKEEASVNAKLAEEARKIAAEDKRRLDVAHRQEIYALETKMTVAKAAGNETEAQRLKEQIEQKRALHELSGLDLQLANERAAAERRIWEQLQAQKAAREQIEAQRLAIEERLAGIRERLAGLEGDFTRTDASKWAERRRAIEQEIAALREAQTLEQKRAADARSRGDTTSAAAHDRAASGFGRQVGSAQRERAGLGADPNSWIEQTQASLTRLLNQVGTTSERIGRNIASSIGGAFDSVSQNLTAFLSGTQTAGEMMNNIGLGIRQSIVGAIVDMGVRWVEQLAIMGVKWIATKLGMAAADKAIAASGTAALIPIALAQSAIWAGPAALATIATFGGAAAAAPGLVMAAKAMTTSLAVLPGARSGGYFPGRDDEVAGVFHGNEFIFSAPAVRALGADNLAAMHQSALSSSSPASTVSMPAMGGGGGRNLNVAVYLDKSAYMDYLRSDMSAIAHEEYGRQARKS